MSAGQGEDAERFAAALEHGSPPGADAGLRRELEIVAMLRSRHTELAPEPDTRARAKQRLLAALVEQNGTLAVPAPSAEERTAPLSRIAPARVDAITEPTVVLSTVAPGLATNSPESDAGVAATAVRPTRIGRRTGRHHIRSRPAGHRSGQGRRAGVLTAAAAFALVAMAGAGVFVSRDALPGDALYGVKRAAESAGLAVTLDELDRGRRHLELATTRLDEVERLVIRRGAGVTPDAELVESAIFDFETTTGEGSRMLLADEGTAGNAAELGGLHAWAAEQAGRLATIRSALPDPAVPEADDSIALLDRLLDRAEALQSRSSCSEVTSGVVDDLGPLPAEGTCAPRSRSTGDPAEAASGTSTDPSVLPEPTGTGEPSREPVTSGTPDTPGTSDTSQSPTGSTTPSSTTPDSRGGLSQLDVGDNPLDAVIPDDDLLPDVPTSPRGESAGDVAVPAPLPLLPPVTLPPLLPGLPGIPIG